MSRTVSAPVLWDGNGNFQNNALVGVEANAIVVGPVMKPTSPGNITQVQTLQVKDRRFGTLYLNWTLSQWQEAANSTSTAGDCLSPVGLLVNAGDTGARITWTDNPSILGIEYANSDIAGVPTGSGTFISTGTSFVMVSDLEPSNTYFFYIRTKCTDTLFSLWTVMEYNTITD